MIELKIKEKTVETSPWEDKLIELSLAHKVVVEPSQEQPVLTHGNEEYLGEKDISAYLEELEKFVFNWRKCACEG